jgi:hypothetical protein
MPNDSRKVVSEDHLLGLLPDTILPSQFFELVGAEAFSSEQRLMLAILVDAINVLGGAQVPPNSRQREASNDALSWIFADGITSPLSFDHVCDALGVDAELLRRRLSEVVSENGRTLLRLRLKQATRIKRPTVNRVRVRRRRRPSLANTGINRSNRL